MKDDERNLLDELRKRTSTGEVPYVRDVVQELGMPEKRAAFLCEKWTAKGWYDYGVNVLAGWLTESGLRTPLCR